MAGISAVTGPGYPVIGLALCAFFAVCAIVLGVIAIKKKYSKGMARAGIIIGASLLGQLVAFGLLYLLLSGH